MRDGIIISEPDEIASIDLVADEAMQVEVQHEAGTQDRYKLYVHYLGRTIIRICKLREEQFAIAGMRVVALVPDELVQARELLATIANDEVISKPTLKKVAELLGDPSLDPDAPDTSIENTDEPQTDAPQVPRGWDKV